MADETKVTEAETTEKTPAGDANRAETKAETPEAKPKVEPGDTIPKSEVENIVRARLKAYEDDQKKKADKDQKAAVAAALKEQGDYQKLAEAKEQEIREAQDKLAALEPVVTERDRYKAVLQAQLKAQRKDLPGHITGLLDRLDPADQLEYLAENAEAIKVAMPAPEVKPNGSTPHRKSSTTAIGDTKPQLPLPPFPLA